MLATIRRWTGAKLMGHNDHIDYDLHDLLYGAIDAGHLDEEADKDAIGVARQAVSLGYDSLSAKQRALYDAVVVPALEARAIEFRKIDQLNRSGPD